MVQTRSKRKAELEVLLLQETTPLKTTRREFSVMKTGRRLSQLPGLSRSMSFPEVIIMSYASLSVKDLTSLVSRSGSGSSSSLKPPGQTRPVKVILLQHPDTSNEARPPSIPFDDIFSGWTVKIKRMRLVDWIDTLFPCFRWIRTYRWSEYFQLDLMAGITVGIILVPQAMSYAKLAGLLPITVYTLHLCPYLFMPYSAHPVSLQLDL